LSVRTFGGTGFTPGRDPVRIVPGNLLPNPHIGTIIRIIQINVKELLRQYGKEILDENGI
jgi:hypothetical protein